MPYKPPAPRSRDAFGLEHQTLVGGAFYQCIQVGGFTDSTTGIHIAGPKAILDDTLRREIVALTDIPEPVQIPHFKLVREVSDSGKSIKEVEKDFCAMDEMPICEAFLLALATGVIRMVPDYVMEEKYPQTWETRKEKYVFRDSNTLASKPMRELFAEAEEAEQFARIHDAAAKMQQVKQLRESRQAVEAEIDAPATGRKPPPPRK